jgi:hypothetical protein
MVAPICLTCGNPIAIGSGYGFQHNTCRERARTDPPWRVRRDWRGRLIVQRKTSIGRYVDAKTLEDIAALLQLEAFRPADPPAGFLIDAGWRGPIGSNPPPPYPPPQPPPNPPPAPGYVPADGRAGPIVPPPKEP